MPFDFELVPLNPSGRFAPDVLGEMRAWWAAFPTDTSADGTMLVFPTEEDRAIRLARARSKPHENDYLTAMITFRQDRVDLSVTGDETTPWIHAFALECERRWHAELRYFDERVPAEDILAAR